MRLGSGDEPTSILCMSMESTPNENGLGLKFMQQQGQSINADPKRTLKIPRRVAKARENSN